MCNEVVCPYKGKCTREGMSCQTCERNTGKRDYYLPKRDWYTPYYPWYPPITPIYPCPYPYVTWITSNYDTGNIFSTNALWV